MAVTFKWSILGVETTPNLAGKMDVVSRVQWGCWAQKLMPEGHYKTEQASGWIDIDYDPDASFVGRHQLNDEIVLQWCFGLGLSKEAVEAELQDALDQNAENL